MGKIIAIANQKGGVGKTTTSVNLSACLAEAGKTVLMVDLDPQGNSTSGLGCNVTERNSIYDVMMGRARFEDCIQKTELKKLKLIGSDIRLAGAEVELVSVPEREYYLKKLLAPSRNDFDFIIIDCPPSLSLLTLNAMAAADTVLIPIQCEYYALEGVKSLMDTINRVKRTFNPHLEIEGILLTMLDGRTNLGLQVVDTVKKHFKKAVFATTIPRNVRLGEAPSHGEPINIYDPRSTGAMAYEALAKEVIRRNKGKSLLSAGDTRGLSDRHLDPFGQRAFRSPPGPLRPGLSDLPQPQWSQLSTGELAPFRLTSESMRFPPQAVIDSSPLDLRLKYTFVGAAGDDQEDTWARTRAGFPVPRHG